MRLEITEPKTSAREIIQAQKAARERLRAVRSTAGLSRVAAAKPSVPRTRISWTFGGITETGNVITFDFSPVSIAQIIDAVCDFYNVSRMDVLSIRRETRVVYPRQVAMYLAREMTPKSFPVIATLFERDHTTALASWRKIGRLVNSDERTASEVAVLKRKIRS